MWLSSKELSNQSLDLHADLGMPCSGSLQEVCCSTGDGKIKLAANCQATSRLSSYMFTMSMTNI